MNVFAHFGLAFMFKPAIAQLVEHLTVELCSDQMVLGSIPGSRTFCVVLAHAEATVLSLPTNSRWTFAFLAAFKHAVDTLGIEPRASRMLSECDTTTPCAPAQAEASSVLL